MIFRKGEVLIMSKVLVIYFSASGVTVKLAGSCPGAELKEGKRFPADVSVEELKAWAEGFGI